MIIISCLMYCYWQPVILYTSLIAINLFSRVNKILFSIIFAKHNGCMCNTLSFPPSLFLSIKVTIPTTELQRRTHTHLRFLVCPFPYSLLQFPTVWTLYEAVVTFESKREGGGGGGAGRRKRETEESTRPLECLIVWLNVSTVPVLISDSSNG